MKRRLYFLLPDREHTRSIVDELAAVGIDTGAMHTIAKPEVDLSDLPAATDRQREAPVHKHHPEAVVGGVGWHIDALHTRSEENVRATQTCCRVIRAYCTGADYYE